MSGGDDDDQQGRAHSSTRPNWKAPLCWGAAELRRAEFAMCARRPNLRARPPRVAQVAQNAPNSHSAPARAACRAAQWMISGRPAGRLAQAQPLERRAEQNCTAEWSKEKRSNRSEELQTANSKLRMEVVTCHSKSSAGPIKRRLELGALVCRVAQLCCKVHWAELACWARGNWPSESLRAK